MNIIMLGLFFSDKALKNAYNESKCGVQIAPHKFQTNLLSGFEALENINVRAINIPPIGSYPIHYKRLIIKRELWGDGNIQIGFVNLPFIKRSIQIRRIIKAASRMIREYGECDTHLLIYHTFKPFLKCARALKRRFPKLKISLIMTDPIPGRGDFERNMNERAVKEGGRIVNLAKVCDSFVLLTEHMKEPLEVGARPYTVVECISDSTQPHAKITDGKKKVCLYTGTLDRDFGILDLAKAFQLITDAQLWICGRGNALQELKEISNQNKNIKCFGFLPQDRIAKLRDECDYLINPRRPTGTFTKYSFPSKTAEYMASGKPVIMYKLEGIPDEYDEHLVYLSATSPKEMAEELKEIFSSPYSKHLEKADAAYHFIKNEKSSVAQATKIINLIAEI